MKSSQLHTLLVVDDEVEITNSIVGLFRREFTVFAANSAADAVAILEREDVHVLMTDQRMPGTTGTAFLAGLSESYPEMVRILLTGYADIQAAIDAINTGQVYRYMAKPWNPDELMSVVRQAAQRHDMLVERNSLVANLQTANQELRELDRVRKAFLEIVGHELKTPITVLLGYTHLLHSGCYGELPAPAKPAVGNLAKTIGHLNELVMKTLKLLKADLRGDTMNWEIFPVAEIVAEAKDTVQTFLDLRKQLLEVQAEQPAQLIRGDRRKLVDVLVNLLTNAIKFSVDGAVLTARTSSGPAGFVQLEIADKGAGIAAEDLPHVFDRFFSSFDVGHHSTGDYQYGRRGVGLGLAIVKRFVELHGGTLELKTVREAGTTVTFTVPAAPASASPAIV